MNHSSISQVSIPTLIQLSPHKDLQTLQSAENLFNELNRQDIRYCHWKSNLRLQWGLEGRTDLDLLVDKDQESSFKRILADQEIKPILPPAGKQYPGMDHYLCFDESTGRLIHLHVHYELILGEQFVKNYLLPFEKQFLDSATLRGVVKVPSTELELIVLTIRALIKYRDRDAVKDILSIRSPGIPTHILSEILWLLDCTSLQNVALVLRSLPELRDPDIILEFLNTMQSDPRNGRRLLQLRRRVRKMLRPFQRHNRLWASLNYTRLSTRKMFIQRSKPDRQMSLPGAGLMIALVGVDGAGKSTVCAELKQWLSWKVDLFFYYQGSKQPSIWTDWSYIFFRIARRGHRELSAWMGESSLIPKCIASVRQSLLALHYLFVGRDRYKRYRLAKTQTANGSVVLFDRFPLVAPLDGPQIHLIEDGRLNIVSRFLSRIEIGLYQKYEPVDLLLILNVSLDTSLQRKPDHPRETILAKNAVLNQVKANLAEEPDRWNWVLIDADKPFDEVLLDVKRTVWAAL